MKQTKTEMIGVKVTASERIAFDRLCRKEGKTNQSEVIRGLINTAISRR